MSTSCPGCGTAVGFWQKFNTSRFKHAECTGCGKKLSVAHHFFGLVAAICIPVIARHFAMQQGIEFPLWLQLVLPIPLLYIIFRFLLPLVEVADAPDDKNDQPR